MEESKRATIRRRRLEATAYHEAGHAVANIVLKIGFHHVTIEPGEGGLGHILKRKTSKPFRPGMQIGPKTKDRIEAEVLASMAGLAAEARFTGRNNFRMAGSDIDDAVTIASFRYSGEVRDKYIAFMTARAREFVQSPPNWVQVKALAAALLERKKLTDSEAREVCRDAIQKAARRIKAIDF